MREIAPAAYIVLNLTSRKRYGKHYAELLAELRLAEVKELLESIYGSGARLRTTIYMFVARPLAEALGRDIDPHEVTLYMLNNEWEKLHGMINTLSTRELQPAMHEAYEQLLFCSYVVERIAAEAYRLIARKSKDPAVSVVALYIGEESKTHSEVIRTLADLLLAEPITDLSSALSKCNDPNAKKFLEFYNSMKNELEKGVSSDRIAEYLVLLADMEKIIGEEKYEETLLPLIKTMLSREKYSEIVSLLIDAIVSDEEYHERLAEATARYLFGGREAKKESKH